MPFSDDLHASGVDDARHGRVRYRLYVRVSCGRELRGRHRTEEEPTPNIHLHMHRASTHGGTIPSLPSLANQVLSTASPSAALGGRVLSSPFPTRHPQWGSQTDTTFEIEDIHTDTLSLLVTDGRVRDISSARARIGGVLLPVSRTPLDAWIDLQVTDEAAAKALDVANAAAASAARGGAAARINRNPQQAIMAAYSADAKPNDAIMQLLPTHPYDDASSACGGAAAASAAHSVSVHAGIAATPASAIPSSPLGRVHVQMYLVAADPRVHVPNDSKFLSFPEILHPLTFHFITWNVGNAPLPDDLRALLPPSSASTSSPGPSSSSNVTLEDVDVVLVGLQECQYDSSHERDLTGRPLHAQSSESSIMLSFSRLLPDDFVRVTSANLWQIRMLLFVRRRIQPLISHLTVDTVATGIGNVVGNKGGVVVSFHLADTRFAFVVAHLAAHMDRAMQRDKDWSNIVRSITWNNTDGAAVVASETSKQSRHTTNESASSVTTDLLSHFHHVFVLGDLNYRLEYVLHQNGSSNNHNMDVRSPTSPGSSIDGESPLSPSTSPATSLSRSPTQREFTDICSMIRAGAWSTLLQYDQLRHAPYLQPASISSLSPSSSSSPVSSSSSFPSPSSPFLGVSRLLRAAWFGFEESLLSFAPSFKVLRGLCLAYDCKRTPSWCDRVLFRSAVMTSRMREGQAQTASADGNIVSTQAQTQWNRRKSITSPTSTSSTSRLPLPDDDLIHPLSYRLVASVLSSDHKPVVATLGLHAVTLASRMDHSRGGAALTVKDVQVRMIQPPPQQQGHKQSQSQSSSQHWTLEVRAPFLYEPFSVPCTSTPANTPHTDAIPTHDFSYLPLPLLYNNLVRIRRELVLLRLFKSTTGGTSTAAVISGGVSVGGAMASSAQPFAKGVCLLRATPLSIPSPHGSNVAPGESALFELDALLSQSGVVIAHVTMFVALEWKGRAGQRSMKRAATSIQIHGQVQRHAMLNQTGASTRYIADKVADLEESDDDEEEEEDDEDEDDMDEDATAGGQPLYGTLNALSSTAPSSHLLRFKTSSTRSGLVRPDWQRTGTAGKVSMHAQFSSTASSITASEKEENEWDALSPNPRRTAALHEAMQVMTATPPSATISVPGRALSQRLQSDATHASSSSLRSLHMLIALLAASERSYALALDVLVHQYFHPISHTLLDDLRQLSLSSPMSNNVAHLSDQLLASAFGNHPLLSIVHHWFDRELEGQLRIVQFGLDLLSHTTDELRRSKSIIQPLSFPVGALKRVGELFLQFMPLFTLYRYMTYAIQSCTSIDMPEDVAADHQRSREDDQVTPDEATEQHHHRQQIIRIIKRKIERIDVANAASGGRVPFQELMSLISGRLDSYRLLCQEILRIIRRMAPTLPAQSQFDQSNHSTVMDVILLFESVMESFDRVGQLNSSFQEWYPSLARSRARARARARELEQERWHMPLHEEQNGLEAMRDGIDRDRPHTPVLHGKMRLTLPSHDASLSPAGAESEPMRPFSAAVLRRSIAAYDCLGTALPGDRPATAATSRPATAFGMEENEQDEWMYDYDDHSAIEEESDNEQSPNGTESELDEAGHELRSSRALARAEARCLRQQQLAGRVHAQLHSSTALVGFHAYIPSRATVEEPSFHVASARVIFHPLRRNHSNQSWIPTSPPLERSLSLNALDMLESVVCAPAQQGWSSIATQRDAFSTMHKPVDGSRQIDQRVNSTSQGSIGPRDHPVPTKRWSIDAICTSLGIGSVSARPLRLSSAVGHWSSHLVAPLRKLAAGRACIQLVDLLPALRQAVEPNKNRETVYVTKQAAGEENESNYDDDQFELDEDAVGDEFQEEEVEDEDELSMGRDALQSVLHATVRAHARVAARSSTQSQSGANSSRQQLAGPRAVSSTRMVASAPRPSAASRTTSTGSFSSRPSSTIPSRSVPDASTTVASAGIADTQRAGSSVTPLPKQPSKSPTVTTSSLIAPPPPMRSAEPTLPSTNNSRRSVSGSGSGLVRNQTLTMSTALRGGQLSALRKPSAASANARNMAEDGEDRTEASFRLRPRPSSRSKFSMG